PSLPASHSPYTTLFRSAVPTRFIQFDHSTRVGGLPIERFMLMHGPSGLGKTEMAIGLEDSFLERDHFVFHVDSERTTPITWAEQDRKSTRPELQSLRHL